MLGGAMYTTIKTLWTQKKNKTEIAKITGHNWRTVDKVIKATENGQEYPVKKPHPNKLDDYKEVIQEKLEKGFTGVLIHEYFKNLEINISYSSIAEYIKRLKKRSNIHIRFHTEPGAESQVDFGYVGLIKDKTGRKRKAYVFHMVLSYSRYDYYEIVFDQKVETFIKCHENAFEYFGGVPEYVKIDNLKAAILEANFYEPIYQEQYKQFADYYEFKAIPCRVRQPQEKGKVESGIKYIKNRFFLGRTFKDIIDATNQLNKWLVNTCNARIHGTTRRVPKELFEQEEQSILKKLLNKKYYFSELSKRLVYTDCHVYVKYNYYSVPYEYVGKEVDIEIKDKILKIHYEYKEIAVHKIIESKGKFSTNESHYPVYKRYNSTEYKEIYEAKMQKIGANAVAFFKVYVGENQINWNRAINGILSLLKTYTPEIIDAACKRALKYDALKYQIVRNICQNGSYNLPIDKMESHEEAIYAHN
ncbi:IS21 family transposase [bacterium]